MDIQIIYKLLYYISIFLALIIIVPAHEFAHGFAAVKSGDPTPKLYNRYTINPLAHFDLIGLACFLFVGLGWGKPMPVNPSNFRNIKKGSFFVAIAGVATNYILAFISLPLFILADKYIPDFGYFTYVLVETLYLIFHLNLILFVFNLLPIYPLDGFRIIDVFSKKRSKIYSFLRYYGVYLLYFFFALSTFADLTGLAQFDILGFIINKLAGYISIPIRLFWGLFF